MPILTIRNILLSGLAACAAALLASCGSIPEGSGLPAYHAYDRPAKLPDNPDAVIVKVSLGRQRTYVMEGSRILLVMPVSIGTAEEPTPTGAFRVINKVEKKRSDTDGYAYKGTNVKKSTRAKTPAGYSFTGTPLPYWCGFQPGRGFHTGWVKHHPCTDGSIRMHENLAPKFFRLVKIGTPVIIAYSQPEDATVANFPLPPDAGPLPDYPGSMYVGDGYFQQHAIPRYR